MKTADEVEETCKLVRKIFDDVTEIEKEVDRIQGNWFLKWFTLRRQCVLIETAQGLLNYSQKLLDELSE